MRYNLIPNKKCKNTYNQIRDIEVKEAALNVLESSCHQQGCCSVADNMSRPHC